MPLTVITVTNATRGLRGDLTKWMQEISTGVYIGNFNARIREELWNRVKEAIKNGEATLTYQARTELGYSFETINTHREIIDFDGLELVFIEKKKPEYNEKTEGFSKAARFRKAKNYSSVGGKKKVLEFVILDIETDGLQTNSDKILEIGALKIKETVLEEFHHLISYGDRLPSKIKELTGLNESLLQEEGKKLEDVLPKLLEFIGEYRIVGYNIGFDISFLNRKLKQLNLPRINNKSYDLLRLVKKEKMFLDRYTLDSVLKSYGLNDKVPHRALEDCYLIYELSKKVNKFQEIIKR